MEGVSMLCLEWLRRRVGNENNNMHRLPELEQRVAIPSQPCSRLNNRFRVPAACTATAAAAARALGCPG